MTREFHGPVFIVGMSRSGTKLLRDVLNNNDLIGMPTFESHFIPYLIKNYTGKFPLDSKESKKIKRLIKSSIFYNEIKRKHQNFKEIDFDKLAQQKDIQNATKFIILSLTQKSNIKIWGDKTPNNLFHMTLLKETFPTAKFIHIIRDPRERALSTKKAWGTSLLASAERWSQGMKAAKTHSKNLKGDYIEVTYEALITNPEEEIKKLCGFLGVKYSKSMIQLKESAELYNTAQNNTMSALTIVGGNTEKYKKWLKKNEIKQIESTCGSLLVQAGYKPTEEIQPIQIGTTKRTALKIRDGLMTINFHIRRWGLIRGLKYLVWRKKVTI